MNDFHMNFLANEHRTSLMAEADRQRLARQQHTDPERSRRSKRAHRSRLSPALFFGRVVLF